jgi:vancomycin permeability regulator SanA
MTAMRLALFVLLASCTDARDLLRPYSPDDAEMRAMVERPWPVKQFDVAVVLGCPAELDGTPSMCERCRVKTAVRDFRKGVVRNLLFSGGAAHSAAVEADVMAELAIKRGVPKERVLREGRALTTWQNIKLAQRILRRENLRTLLFVSTSDHLARAHRIAEWYGVDDKLSAYQACDLDLPADSDEEFAPTPPSPAMSD